MRSWRRSQHQDEIAMLKGKVSQQKACHQGETGKQKDAGKDEGVENTSTRLEKPDLEAMIGQLLQKNGELVKAASTAIEETIRVRARVRGQQNRVAELEGQIAIMTQIEEAQEAVRRITTAERGPGATEYGAKIK